MFNTNDMVRIVVCYFSWRRFSNISIALHTSLQTIKKIMTENFPLSDNLTAASVFRVLFLYIRFNYMRGMYVDSETWNRFITPITSIISLLKRSWSSVEWFADGEMQQPSRIWSYMYQRKKVGLQASSSFCTVWMLGFKKNYPKHDQKKFFQALGG